MVYSLLDLGLLDFNGLLLLCHQYHSFIYYSFVCLWFLQWTWTDEPRANLKKHSLFFKYVEEFRRDSGPKLQKLLEERAEKEINWVILICIRFLLISIYLELNVCVIYFLL
jgi:hypothetical protein